ncbi:hypothetical protein [Flavobacterium granuli]|uniref:Uncharacterized protein n=1 Tax=Flavobacterium granuli TaxID=280093 RepID=A0ABU1RY27_9FLAO|nr:hypothetical protein [Flavobacterium granuli]MDR6843673.1 hypothetical protein [Flavobacterium granuli]
MKSIYLTAGQTSDVFNELKDILNGTLTFENNEYTLTLDSNFVKGKIQGTVFDEGMIYMQFDIVFFNDVILSMESLQTSPLFFTYCSEGFFKHSFGLQGDKKKLEKNNSGVLKSTAKVNSILYFERNVSTQFSVIGIGTNKISKDINHMLIKRLRNTFFNNNSDYLQVRTQNQKISLKINELNTIPQEVLFRNLSKKRILETILEMEIKQNTDSFSEISYAIHSSAVRQIDEIKRISNLTINYSQQLFTSEYFMPKIAVINNKLQEGFKSMFIRPVHDFQNYIRIERQRI